MSHPAPAMIAPTGSRSFFTDARHRLSPGGPFVCFLTFTLGYYLSLQLGPNLVSCLAGWNDIGLTERDLAFGLAARVPIQVSMAIAIFISSVGLANPRHTCSPRWAHALIAPIVATFTGLTVGSTVFTLMVILHNHLTTAWLLPISDHPLASFTVLVIHGTVTLGTLMAAYMHDLHWLTGKVLARDAQRTASLQITASTFWKDLADLKNEIDTLKENITTLTNGNVKLAAEGDKLAKDNAQLTEDKVKLTNDNSTLSARKAGLETDIAALRTENSTLNKDNVDLWIEYANGQAASALVEQHNAGLRKANSTLRDANGTLAEENAELKEENTSLVNRDTRRDTFVNGLQASRKRQAASANEWKRKCDGLERASWQIRQKNGKLSAQLRAARNGLELSQRIGRRTSKCNAIVMAKLTAQNASLHAQVKAQSAATTQAQQEATDLREQNSSLASTNETLTSTVRSLQVENQDLQATVHDLQATNQDLRTTNQDLKATNEDLQATNEDLQATVHDLQATNQDLRTTNQDLKATNQDLQATNQDLQATVHDLQATNQDLRTTNQDLKATNEDLQATNQDLHAASQDTQGTVTQQADEIENLHTLVAELQTQQTQDQRELREARAENVNLSANVQEGKEEINTLRAEKAEESTARQTAERQLVTVTNERDELSDALTTSRESEENTSTQLVTATSRVTILQDENARLRTTLGQSKEKILKLGGEADTAKSSLATVTSKANATVNAAQSENIKLRANSEKLRKDLESERKAHEETKTAHADATGELSDAFAQIAQLQEENSTVHKKLAASEADKQELRGVVDVTHDELERERDAHIATQNAHTATTSELSTANAQIANLQKENAVRRSACDTSEAQNIKLRGVVDATRTELQTERDAHTVTTSQLSMANDQVADLQEANATCHTALESSEASNRGLRGVVTATRGELEDERDAHAVTQNALTATTSELSAANVQIATLEKENAVCHSACDTSEAQNIELRGVVDATRTELQVERDAHAVTTSQLSTANDQVADLREANATCHTALESSETMNSELRGVVAATRGELQDERDAHSNTQSTLADTEKTVQELQEKNADLEIENDGLHAEVIDLQSQVNPLHGRISSLRKHSDNQRDEINTLNTQLTTLRQDYANAQVQPQPNTVCPECQQRHVSGMGTDQSDHFPLPADRQHDAVELEGPADDRFPASHDSQRQLQGVSVSSLQENRLTAEVSTQTPIAETGAKVTELEQDLKEAHRVIGEKQRELGKTQHALGKALKQLKQTQVQLGGTQRALSTAKLTLSETRAELDAAIESRNAARDLAYEYQLEMRKQTRIAEDLQGQNCGLQKDLEAAIDAFNQQLKVCIDQCEELARWKPSSREPTPELNTSPNSNASSRAGTPATPVTPPPSDASSAQPRKAENESTIFDASSETSPPS